MRNGEVEKVEERERWVENRGRTRGEMGKRCKCLACGEVGCHQGSEMPSPTLVP